MLKKKVFFLFVGLYILLLLALLAFLRPEKPLVILLFGLLFLGALCCVLSHLAWSIGRLRQAMDTSPFEFLFRSPHSVEDCLSFLSRRNVRDRLFYQFYEEGEAFFIRFLGEAPSGDGRFASLYRLEFRQEKMGCCFRLHFVEEKLHLSSPMIPFGLVEDFMAQKLDAQRLPRDSAESSRGY